MSVDTRPIEKVLLNKLLLVKEKRIGKKSIIELVNGYFNGMDLLYHQ